MTKLDSLQRLNEVMEPFDPTYISDKGYQIPELSSYEKRFLHKVSILEKKLRRAKVKYEWLPSWECFRVKKFVLNSEYPTYRYVWVDMEENDYAFGTEDEALVYDGHSSVVVDAVARWINSDLKPKRTR